VGVKTRKNNYLIKNCMRKIIVTCFGMLIFVYSMGQLITVKDEVTRRSLEFVSVYDVQMKTTVLTNPAGQVSVSLQKESDSLYLSLLGYEPLYITLRQLQDNKFKVYLKPGPIMLRPFEISAIRWQQGNSVSPGQMQIIGASEIAFQNPQTAADMLSSTGNVFVQKSQLGGGSPMIRGFAANRVLIVVDGVRMNNAIFRSGNLQNVINVDPFNIERTEVIFGPGSVAFGSDAIGGVMTFSTFEPGFSPTEKPHIYGKMLTRWSSANSEKTAQLSLNIGMKKWAFLTVAGTSDFGDLRMGTNGPADYLRPHYAETVNGTDVMVVNEDPELQKYSGYSAYNLMQKIRYKPNNHFDITYTFMGNNTGNIPRYDRLLEYRNGMLRSAEWYYGPQLWVMNSLNIVHADTNAMYDKAVLTLAYQYFTESRIDRKFNNNWLRTQNEAVGVSSANLDFSKQMSRNGLLLYGLEGMFNTIGSEAWQTNRVSGETEAVGTRYPDGSHWNTMAAYVLYKQKISDKINLPVGIRYTHILADAAFDTTLYPFPFTDAELNTGTLNGSAGVVWRPDDTWQFGLNLGTGFRAPNMDDLGKVFESEPGNVVVPNPDLSPEYAYSADLGITKIIGKSVRLDVSGFYTYLDDALVRRNFTLNGADSMLYDGELSQIQAIQNASFAYVYGLSGSVEIKFPAGFGFYGTVNWQKGEEELDDGSRAPLRHVPPLFGMSKLTYTYKKVRSEVSFVYNGSITNDKLAPSEQEKPYMYALDNEGNPWSPSWYTFNVRVGVELTSFLNMTAGVENITNIRYRPYSSGITAPGRNFMISFNAAF
jgi:hemoglobin/transferrin/lactoferrin receptor protein